MKTGLQPEIQNRPQRSISLPKDLIRTVSIIGVGAYAPEKILTNADLEKRVETSDEWIITRTGIKERRIAHDGQLTSDLATRAGQKALENAGVKPEEIDLILVATTTPHTPFPSTACYVQKNLQAFNAAAFDINAACSGFLYGLSVAKQFVATGAFQTVLLIGAEKLSTITDWQDRNTCVLFGDGAGAVVLRHCPNRSGILSTLLGADGSNGDILYMSGCAPSNPLRTLSSNEKGYIRMSGREVFKMAVVAMHQAAMRVLEKSGLSIQDVNCIIPHQANIRIVQAIAERMGLGMEHFFVNVHRYGNTSAASIPLALEEAVRTGRIKRGDIVLLVAFGGGLTSASAVLEW